MLVNIIILLLMITSSAYTMTPEATIDTKIIDTFITKKMTLITNLQETNKGLIKYSKKVNCNPSALTKEEQNLSNALADLSAIKKEKATQNYTNNLLQKISETTYACIEHQLDQIDKIEHCTRQNISSHYKKDSTLNAKKLQQIIANIEKDKAIFDNIAHIKINLQEMLDQRLLPAPTAQEKTSEPLHIPKSLEKKLRAIINCPTASTNIPLEYLKPLSILANYCQNFNEFYAEHESLKTIQHKLTADAVTHEYSILPAVKKFFNAIQKDNNFEYCDSLFEIEETTKSLQAENGLLEKAILTKFEHNIEKINKKIFELKFLTIKNDCEFKQYDDEYNLNADIIEGELQFLEQIHINTINQELASELKKTRQIYQEELWSYPDTIYHEAKNLKKEIDLCLKHFTEDVVNYQLISDVTQLLINSTHNHHTIIAKYKSVHKNMLDRKSKIFATGRFGSLLKYKKQINELKEIMTIEEMDDDINEVISPVEQQLKKIIDFSDSVCKLTKELEEKINTLESKSSNKPNI